MSRIHTIQDLLARTPSELYALRRAVECELAMADPESNARRDAVASLDAINRVIRMRAPRGPRL